MIRITSLVVIAASAYAADSAPRLATEVLFQQGVSGYQGASEIQIVNDKPHEGTFLRASNGGVIADRSPEVLQAIDQTIRNHGLSEEERNKRLDHLAPEPHENYHFTLKFALDGIPKDAQIASATVELTVSNLAERSDFNCLRRSFAVAPIDRTITLDVTSAAVQALPNGKSLEAEVFGASGGAWFCGNKDRHIVSRPKLTIRFAAPTAVTAPEWKALPEKSYVSGEAAKNLKSVKLYPGADAMTGDVNHYLNFGAGTSLYVRDWAPEYTYRAFIKFDLNPLQGRAIRGAELNVFAVCAPASNPEKVQAYAVEDEFDHWQEDAITWLTQPNVACQYIIPPLASTPVGPISDPATIDRWYAWNLGGYIDDELTSGNRIASICLKDAYTLSHSLPIFLSRESGADFSPYLTVYYEGDDVKAEVPTIARVKQPIPAGSKILVDFEKGDTATFAATNKQPLPPTTVGATSGAQALTVDFSNQGCHVFFAEPQDFTHHDYFCFDVTYDSVDQAGLGIAFSIEDPDANGDWAKNYHNEEIGVTPGPNTIRIPVKAMGNGRFDLRRISHMHVWMTGREKSDTHRIHNMHGYRPDSGKFHIDAIRLEGPDTAQ